jgi:hypothetical protein
VAAALDGRRQEIEAAIATRAFAVAEPTGAETPGYVEGLRAAIAAALDLAIGAVARGIERAGATPTAVVDQARSAARSKVGLEVVLQRYAAGYSALLDFLLAEVRGLGIGVGAESILQGELTSLFDRLVETVSRAYREEADRVVRPSARRRADLLTRLLDGAAIDRSSFDYDFDGHHLGAIALGPAAGDLLATLAERLDRRLLWLDGGEGARSVWLGGRSGFAAEELGELPRLASSFEASLAIGEPGQGLAGWRLTHRQARAALGIALRAPRPFTRYAEVALLAAAARDADLTAFLTETYLVPLAARGDGGKALCETLSAYLDAGGNISSAAAALGVARQTVASRLRVIEERIGRPLGSCAAELEIALRLRGLET